MKKSACRAPPATIGDCKPSRALIDELAALEAMLEQHRSPDEVEKELDQGEVDQ